MAMQGLGGLAEPKKPLPGATSTLNSPTSSMGGINRPTQPSPPMGGSLNETIGNNYNDLLSGKNAAMDQATRTTLNALGGQRKGAVSDAAQKAARMGLAPGSPGYNQIMSQAENAVTSNGSNLLSGLAQKGLDQQTANLTGAQMFQSGMDKTANESRALGQGDTRIGLEGLRVGNETSLAGNTIKKTDADILNDQGQLGVTKDLAVNTIKKADADIISDQRKDNLNSLLGFNTIKKTDADILNDQGQLGVTKDLAVNTIKKADADILNDAGQLDVTKGLAANTIKATDANIDQGQQKINQSANEFAASLGLDYDKLNQSDKQHLDEMVLKNKGLDQDQDQFNANNLLDTKKMNVTENTSKISALDEIINNPQSYSAAQIAQAKDERAKLAPGGAGTGGAADPSDAANTVSTIASELSQLPENAGKTPEEIQALAKAQYAKIYGINLNSLLGAGATEGVVTPMTPPPSKYYDSTSGVNRSSGFSLTNDPDDPDIAKKRPGETDAVVAARIGKFRKTGQV